MPPSLLALKVWPAWAPLLAVTAAAPLMVKAGVGAGASREFKFAGNEL